MGKRARAAEGEQKLTTAQAVSAALKAVIPARQVNSAANLLEVSETSLRRWRNGQRRVEGDVIEALRRYPGFSAEFDRLSGNQTPESDFLEVARRMASRFGTEGAELVAYQLESLAELMDADDIANLLKSERNRLTKALSRLTAERKVAKSGE